MRYSELYENKLKELKIKIDYFIENGAEKILIQPQNKSITLKLGQEILSFIYSNLDEFHRTIRSLGYRYSLLTPGDRKPYDMSDIINKLQRRKLSPQSVKTIYSNSTYKNL